MAFFAGGVFFAGDGAAFLARGDTIFLADDAPAFLAAGDAAFLTGSRNWLACRSTTARAAFRYAVPSAVMNADFSASRHSEAVGRPSVSKGS
ncbi:hypothetical protein NS14008_24245 [Nocardia seriolae]|nr:hypothetical protein NS14008_24245 [Nocardia seriolae]